MQTPNLIFDFVFVIILTIVGLVFYFIYRYSMQCKEENLERDRSRENEIFQQYLQIKDNYIGLITKLKEYPTNTQQKKDTIEAGQKLIEFTSQYAKNKIVKSSDKKLSITSLNTNNIIIPFDKEDLLNDLPGRTDPIFIKALEICVNVGYVDYKLLALKLGIGYSEAKEIFNTLCEERFVGETKIASSMSPVLLSSLGRLKRRIQEAHEKEKKEQELFQTEQVRLQNSSEYKYIEQFAKKYGKNFSNSELAKLKDLLNIRGFKFSDKEVLDIVNLALNKQKQYYAKIKILHENPKEIQDIIKAYLNFYKSDDNQMFEVLKEIIEEKGFYGSFENNSEKLRKEVEKIEKEIELKIFEKRLLGESEQIQLAKIDNSTGYEFEDFLKTLFSKMGYQVEQTKLSGDQGADLVAVKFGERSVIQAKRFSGNVGNKAVQEVLAAISLYKAQKGIVITNSYFTSAAIELADANDIELIDRNTLEELINKHW